MSDDLRHRFKASKKTTTDESVDSIFGVWEEQRRMQAEEDKIARDLAETKRKAKELSKTLRAHRYGEVKSVPLKKFDLHKNKFTKYVQDRITATKKSVTSHKKPAVAIGVLAILLVSLVGYSILKPNTTGILGDSTDGSAVTIDLPVEKTVFSLLFPSGSQEADFSVKRTNREGSAPSYTYLDSFTDSDPKFQITQQKVPDNFDLEKTATNFQATDVIQIDGNKIYHGLSVKTKVQSLVFVKKDRLVLISSPQKFTDEQWASYILSLQ